MDLIKLTRELGKEIQNSEEYKNINSAKAKNDADAQLQAMIEEFNMCRVKLSTAMQEEDKDEAKLAELDGELKEIYGKIMSNANMIEFNNAKQAIDKLMNDINTILVMCVNGENPDTCEIPEASCGGSCSSCSGCH